MPTAVVAIPIGPMPEADRIAVARHRLEQHAAADGLTLIGEVRTAGDRDFDGIPCTVYEADAA